MSLWSWYKIAASRRLLRMVGRALKWLAPFGLALAVWPVTIVAVIGCGAAWLRGWPPARLRHGALMFLPFTAMWLVIDALRVGGWRGIGPALAADWEHGFRPLTVLGATRAFLLVSLVAVPAGLGLAAVAWWWRNYAVASGIGGWLASAPVTFDVRQWRHQVRRANGVNKAPGAVPLLGRSGLIAVGGTIRAVGHRWRSVFTVTQGACGRHMVIVGATGTGKTNLMMRLWTGWFGGAWSAARAGRGPTPLLVVLDCKGGRDARVKAERTRRLIYTAGARRMAIWPDEARLSIWDLPPAELGVLLYQMIDSGTGAAAYYADILQAVVLLAVTSPAGPPRNRAEFLDRLDAKWLARAWGDGQHAEEVARARAAARHLPDIRLRFATLLGRLGPALDGPGSLTDCDAWYCILEGTSEPSVAEAQALAIVELAARVATDISGEPRAILLAADDYSAVSRRVPLWNLYERGRALGIGVQVSAQSWEGLGADESERYRIASTADGGVWVMGTARPEPLAALAGHRRVLDTAHRLVGNAWGDEGLTREQRAWVADPDLIRRLDVGQACYIHRGAATFVQVARPTPPPLGLPAARAPVVLPRQRSRSGPVEAERPGWPSAVPGAGPAGVDNVLGPGGGA
jgi:hypothetical protein